MSQGTITGATSHTPPSDHTPTAPPTVTTPPTPPPPNAHTSPPTPHTTGYTHPPLPTLLPTDIRILSRNINTLHTTSKLNWVLPLTCTKSLTPPSYAFKNATKSGHRMTKQRAPSAKPSIADGLAPKSPPPTAENRTSFTARTNPAALPR
jgi:hypothetical protein